MSVLMMKMSPEVSQETWWISTREYLRMIVAARRDGDAGTALVNEALVSLTFHFGLSPREAVELRWDDLSQNYQTISIRGRGVGTKTYPMRAAQILLLRNLRKLPMFRDNTHILVSKRWSPMTTGTLLRRIQALAKNAGIERTVTSQMFRFGCGIRLVESHVSRKEIKDWLDYKSMRQVNELVAVLTRTANEAFRALE